MGRRSLVGLAVVLMVALGLLYFVGRVDRAARPAPVERPAASSASPAATTSSRDASAIRAEIPLDDGSDPLTAPTTEADREDAGRPAEAAVTLIGRVVDSRQHPVPGAELFRLRHYEPFRGTRVATTDASGSFRIDHPPGRWSLRIASAEHPDRFERGVAGEPGAVVDGLEFVLDDGAEVRGRVVGAPAEVLESLWVRTVHAGWHVAPAEELPLPPAPRWTRCDADGTFLVRGLERGSLVSVGAHDDEGESYERPLTTVIEVRAGSQDVVLQYLPPTWIIGRVVDARTLQPVTEFELRLGGPTFVASLLDADGRAQRSFPEGRVRAEIHMPGACSALVIDAHGYAPLHKEVSPFDHGELDIGELRLEPSAMLDVHVVDDATGTGVVGALVELRDPASGAPEVDSPWRSLRTDETGAVRLNLLEGKRATLRVTHSAYEPFESELALDGGDRSETVPLRRTKR